MQNAAQKTAEYVAKNPEKVVAAGITTIKVVGLMLVNVVAPIAAGCAIGYAVGWGLEKNVWIEVIEI